MNKYIISFTLSVLLLLGFSCKQQGEKSTNKLTAINPLAYTSVVYSSLIDTVYISTFSGRIARRINNDPKEHIIANIDDEIYALNYVKKQGVVVAATLNSGIVVISIKTGKIIKTLDLNDSWAISLSLTNDEKYLYTSNISGKNFIWDVEKNYVEVNLPESLSGKYLKRADYSNKFYFVARGKAFVWDVEKDIIEDELSIGNNRLVDIDNDGNILLLNHNECLFYDKRYDRITFKVIHPNWIYFNSKGEMLGEIPLSMKLTEARFTGNRIFTGGIDRSIRVWSMDGGKLLDSWTGHMATISDLGINNDQSQLVSIDLKGNIKFWDLTI